MFFSTCTIQQVPSMSYFFLSFDVAALPLAVPRTVLARFLRCLPINPLKFSKGSRTTKQKLPCHYGRAVVHTLLPASLLNLCSRPIPHQPIMRLKLLHHLMAVVYQSEPSRFASAVLCAETEAGYLVFVGLVEFGELLTELVLGDVGAVGVENVTVERGV